MYNEYFGFAEAPFSISPDPHFLYLSQRHREALAHLIYGAGENGGFVLLTGQVGTGKTTLIRSLIERGIDGVDVALCMQSALSSFEFVASILDELHVPYSKNINTMKPLIDALNRYLLAAHAKGRRTVLIVDEAQNLTREVLEQIRLLTNLETNRQKLLRIILVGQEELQENLARNDLRQLSQRITARYHLSSLELKEVKEFITYRINVAGGNPQIFSSGAIKKIYKLTGGTPRLINIICDKALISAYSQNQKEIKVSHIKQAALEALPANQKNKQGSKKLIYGLVALLLIAGTGAAYEFDAITQLKKLFNNQNIKTLERNAINTSSDRLEAHQIDTVKENEALVDALPNSEKENNVSRETLDKYLLGLQGNQAAGVIYLLEQWGKAINIDANNSICDQIETINMTCITSSGGFQLLKVINRPSLMKLRDASGKTSWLPVIGIKGKDFLALIDGKIQNISVVDVATYWTGDFLVLLEKPNVQLTISEGFSGNEVKWLRQRIAIANHQDYTKISSSNTYDLKLVEKVKSFQKRYLLTVDGTVGNRTLLYLYNVVPKETTPILFENGGS